LIYPRHALYNFGEELSNKCVDFVTGKGHFADALSELDDTIGVEKRLFRRHCLTENDHLPRQTQDYHKEP